MDSLAVAYPQARGVFLTVAVAFAALAGWFFYLGWKGVSLRRRVTGAAGIRIKGATFRGRKLSFTALFRSTPDHYLWIECDQEIKTCTATVSEWRGLWPPRGRPDYQGTPIILVYGRAAFLGFFDATVEQWSDGFYRVEASLETLNPAQKVRVSFPSRSQVEELQKAVT